MIKKIYIPKILITFLFIYFITFTKSLAELNRLNIILNKKLNNSEKQYVLINLKIIPNLSSAFFIGNLNNLTNLKNLNMNFSEILVLNFNQDISNKSIYFILNPLVNIFSNIENPRILFLFNKEINCQECKNSIIKHLNLLDNNLIFEINKNLLFISLNKDLILQDKLGINAKEKKSEQKLLKDTNFNQIINEIYNCSYEIYTPL
ncbi:MAG: hypothetical protein ACP5RD_02740 [bacterium]|jgi:hypothetical protein